MNQNRVEVFENYKIPKAVWTLALPTIIGMIVMVLYNLVDTFFIGQTNDPNQVSAVSLAMPIFFILMAFGNLFGIGASANISRNLGAGNYERVSKISSFAFYTALVVGVLLSVFGLLNMDLLVTFTGADELSAPFVHGYLSYIAMGAPFIILSSTLSYIIRSEGNAKTAMIGMMLSTIANIILDPIFIFTFDLGVAGAAVATVLANILAVIYYIIVIIRMKQTHLSLKIKDFSHKDSIAKEVFAIGVPASLSNILMSLANIVYNSYLISYGNDPVAAMGIVMKISMMYVMIFLGLTTGIQPLLGYSYGANNSKRLKDTIIYAFKITFVIGLFFLLIFYFGAENMIRGFIDDESIIEYGVMMLRAQSSTAPILGIMFIVMSTMQVAGKGMVSLVLSICRQGLVFIPAIMLLDATLGLNGLVWAQAVSDVFSVIISIGIFVWFSKYLNDKQNKI